MSNFSSEDPDSIHRTDRILLLEGSSLWDELLKETEFTEASLESKKRILEKDPSKVQYVDHEMLVQAVEEAELEFLTTVRNIDPRKFLGRDERGNSLLDGEFIVISSLPMIRFLLDVFVELNFETYEYTMNRTNFNPLTELCEFAEERIGQMHGEIESGVLAVGDGYSLDLGPALGGGTIWERVLLVMKAFYNKWGDDELRGDGEPSIFKVLHAAAGIHCFPPNLLRLLVACFPDSLNDYDEDGNLPIHVAATNAGEDAYQYFTDCDIHEANEGTMKTTIDILLAARPLAAKTCNRHGKLPLELAIESGRYMADVVTALLEHYPQAARLRSSTGKLPLQQAIECKNNCDEVVDALLKVFPRAVDETDSRTKLPLFLLAATERCSPSVIYSLFRARPLATSSVTDSTGEEKKRSCVCRSRRSKRLKR